MAKFPTITSLLQAEDTKADRRLTSKCLLGAKGDARTGAARFLPGCDEIVIELEYETFH
jgi:hypothetical protein